jgi:hypothetical protein
MKTLKQEIMIFISALTFCYIAHKLNAYNVIIIYILARIWIENKCR